MTALIWKEFRERRLWALPLFASTLGLVAFHSGYTFWLSPNPGTFCIIPSMLVALLIGTATYSGELGWGTSDFLYSRPIPWKRVLLSKLIVGLGMIVTAILLTGAIFRVVCPEPYIKFLTVKFMVQGAGLALLIMGIPYIIGTICSVVLPKIIGAVLFTMAVLIGMAAEMALIGNLSGGKDHSMSWIAAAWLIGAALGALVILRFGITLPLRERVGRYLLALMATVACITPLHFKLPPDRPIRQMSGYMPMYHWFSPDGRYAVRQVGDFSHRESVRSNLVRLSDNKTAQFDVQVWPPEFQWTSDDTVYWVEAHPVPAGTKLQVADFVAVRMDPSGKLHVGRIALPNYWHQRSLASPDGAIVALYDERQYTNLPERPMITVVHFADLGGARLLPKQVTVTNQRGSWWQSDTEFAWIDNKDQRHTIRVPR